MALQKYTLTATVALAAGTPATVVAGEPMTGGAAGFGSDATLAAGGETAWPATGPLLAGTAIVLDPAGALFTQIGAGNLAAFRDGTDNVGHAALSN